HIGLAILAASCLASFACADRLQSRGPGTSSVAQDKDPPPAATDKSRGPAASSVPPDKIPPPAVGDWLQFRGPGGAGIATDKDMPVEWSDKKNVVWKTEMPGFGASSPIVVGDKVFLTCYSGYGLNSDKPGDQKDLKRHLVCVDRKSGKISWS